MKKQVSYVLVFVLVVAGVGIILATHRDPVERYARARGNAIGKSTQELLERCKQGEIDTQQATRILHIMTPRLVNMMQHKNEGKSPLNMGAAELHLCWQLIINRLLPPAQAEAVLRCLDTSWCEYKPAKPERPPRFELHEELTCPVQAIVIQHRVWITGGHEQQEPNMVLEGYTCVKESGMASMTLEFDRSLGLDIDPQQPLSVEKETVVYYISFEVVKELPFQTENEEDLALCRKATTHQNAVTLCTYREFTVLHEDNKWKNGFYSDVSQTR